MKEQDIQRKIIKYLESKDAYIVKVISASKAGIPDIIGCINGQFFAIEVKTSKTKNNISKLQQYNLDKIRSCNGKAIVAYELNQVKEFIDEILKIRRNTSF